MPAATTNPGVSSEIIERRVFALELNGLPTLAFEATEISIANEIVRSAWFRRAVDRLCQNRPLTDSNTRPRPATAEEASLFHDLAEEFAEPTEHFFVAHLPGRGA